MLSQSPELTMDEVKQYLKGAGFDTEEDMPEDYMRSCYDAIKSSEVSFGEEHMSKDTPEVVSPPKPMLVVESHSNEEKAPSVCTPTPGSVFKPREWMTRKKNTPTTIPEILIENDEPEVKPEKNGKLSLLKKTYRQIRSEFDDIDPFDCAPFQQRVEIKTRQPIYGTPIYCDPQTLKLSFRDRFARIYSMHKAYAIRLQKIQSQSKEYVPWPSPISASKNNKSETSDESQKSDLVLSQEVEEVYTSKKGRIVKRKLYVEVTEDDVGFKTSKSPEMPRKKQAVAVDVMKKSRLFGDAVKESARGKKIFDKVVEEDRERRLKEEEMNKFTLSLAEPTICSSDDDEIQNAAETQVEFPRIVVPPPSRKPIKRKLTKNKNSNEQTSKETTVCLLQSESACPICSKTFSNGDLLEHASRCGEFEENTRTKRSANATTTEMCGCGKVFALKAEYETHKQNCSQGSISE